jgi:hypothetical protein
MNIWLEIAIAFVASSGFWALITNLINRKSASTKMLIGLGHDRIISLGMSYIDRGWITEEEYDNLINYLYMPYAKLGGNGTAERVMKGVEKLPIRKSQYLLEDDKEDRL